MEKEGSQKNSIYSVIQKGAKGMEQLSIDDINTQYIGYQISNTEIKWDRGRLRAVLSDYTTLKYSDDSTLQSIRIDIDNVLDAVLDDDEWLVIHLIYQVGYKTTEISDVIGYKTSKVLKIVSKAERKIIKGLKGDIIKSERTKYKGTPFKDSNYRTKVVVGEYKDADEELVVHEGVSEKGAILVDRYQKEYNRNNVMLLP